MKEFFKKYLWWLLGIFVVPLLVSYFWFAFNGFITAGDIDKNHWLTFWGGFLAFYGTVFLGLVAIWQNEKSSKIAHEANELSKKLVEIQKNRDINDKLIMVDITNTIDSTPTNHIYLKNSLEDLTRSNTRRDDYWCFHINNVSSNVMQKIQILSNNELLFDVEQSILPGSKNSYTILFSGMLSAVIDQEIDLIFKGLYNVKSYAKCKIVKPRNSHGCLESENYIFKGYKD